MHLPSCLALIELAVLRDGDQQLLVRANRRFAVPHENNVLQLWEVIQPVRDQEDDLIVCVGLQGCKNGILRAAVQRGKRIVQNQNGPCVGKRSGQGQPLRLAAGKPRAAAADDGVQPLLHGKHLVIQCRRGEPGLRVLIASAENVILNRVGAQLRVVS